jgi:predicted amidohydrolase YtcJ
MQGWDNNRRGPLTLIDNATVYLERDRFAGAALIDGAYIRAVGEAGDLLKLIPPGADLRRVDGLGGLLVPGFHDSHLHLWHYGCGLNQIDLRGCSSIDELVERGKAALRRMGAPPGSVISGKGWNQEEFREGAGGAVSAPKRYPNRFDLDRISQEHALILERICGHTASCNTKALEIAGLMGAVPEVDGGRAETDGEGRALGIFHENAIALLRRIIPPFSKAQVKAQVKYGMEEALSQGLSSVSCNDIFDDNYEEIVDTYREILEEGIRLRVVLQVHITKDIILEDFIRRGWFTGANLGHPLLSMGALKLFADGSLGSRTAHLSEPYADLPGVRGLRAMEDEAMAAAVSRFSGLGFQVIIHAIGDAAAAAAIRSFEALSPDERRRMRHGLVHCEVMSPALLERMARGGFLALVQPAFLAGDVTFAGSRLGRERAAFFLALGSMARLGIRTAYGTDCPVEPLNPLKGIECAVRRHYPAEYAEAPGPCFFPEERVDAYTAIDAYTEGSAYAVFAERRLGRIRPGYLADLTLLDRDIFTLPPEEIGTAKVLLTMVGGESAYRIPGDVF